MGLTPWSASQCVGWAFWDSLSGGVGLRENTGCQVRDKILMCERPRCVWEGETNAVVRRKIGQNGCPFSVGWDDVYWQSWVELVGQSNLSHRCRSETTLGWCLNCCLWFERLMRLFVCKKKLSHARQKWRGSSTMWFVQQSDSDRKTQCSWAAMNAFRLRKAPTFDRKSSRNLTLWDSCISCAKSNPLNQTN